MTLKPNQKVPFGLRGHTGICSGGPYAGLGIEPGLSMCKAHTLPLDYFSAPQKGILLRLLEKEFLLKRLEQQTKVDKVQDILP